MSDSLPAHKKTGVSVPRDTRGRFAPAAHASGPAAVLLEKTTTADDDTILDVKVHNPLHKIFDILQEIKRHQATTFTLRFTIPLIALPVFLLAAFQLGRAQIACVPQFSSKIGVLKELSVLAPKTSPGFFTTMLSAFPMLPRIEATADLVSQHRTILLTPSGEAYTVLHTKDVPTDAYDTKQVIITGNVSTCTNSITLDSPHNISALH